MLDIHFFELMKMEYSSTSLFKLIYGLLKFRKNKTNSEFSNMKFSTDTNFKRFLEKCVEIP